MPATLQILRGDITQLQVDAIVNAANRTLLGGGGVDGANHPAAGPRRRVACRKLNGCQTGEAKITEGFRLPARFVIHTVGPVWRGGTHREAELLGSCYLRSLELAHAHRLNTIAFPNISTGVYGFPKERAATIALQAVRSFLDRPHTLEEVIFALFDEENFQIYRELLG
jgi:O-acetyl-ADP-ribose deacetylase (regulator of RNase III)